MYLAMGSRMQIIGFRTVGNVELEVGSVSAETKREARPTRDQRVLHLCADLHHCVSPTGLQNIFSVFLKGPILLKTWTPSRLFDVAPGAACILEVPHVARLLGCVNARFCGSTSSACVSFRAASWRGCRTSPFSSSVPESRHGIIWVVFAAVSHANIEKFCSDSIATEPCRASSRAGLT